MACSDWLLCLEYDVNDYTDEQVAVMNAARERALEICFDLQMLRACAADPTVTKAQVIAALDAYLEHLDR